MKRILNLFLFGLPIAIAIALFVIWLAQPTDPISRANFEQIQPGMTREQVELILGTAGIEGSGDGRHFPVSWTGRGRSVITVHFNHLPDGHTVNRADFFDPSLWDRAKEWWGGYELYPDGGRTKRLEEAA